METLVGLIVVLLVAVIGWILSHNSQCRDVSERLTRLEEWRKNQEGDR